MTNASPDSVTGAAAQPNGPVPEQAHGNVPAPSELYQKVRAQLEHINNTLAQRVIWLTIGQSFFFGAYATLVTGKEGSPPLAERYQALLLVLPIAALAAVVLTGVDVVASLAYMRGLRQVYEKGPKDEKVDGYYPLVHGRPGHRVFEHASPLLLPVLFLCTWLYVLLGH